MNARKVAPAQRDQVRMMVAHATRGTVSLSHATPHDLGTWIRRGDALVVNDAATLPASIVGRAPSGRNIELRLFSRGPGRWSAVTFGSGTWRTPTERRGLPETLSPGDSVTLSKAPGSVGAQSLELTIASVHDHSSRLVDLELRDETELVRFLYEYGRPIQYSYLTEELPIEAFQTAFADRPWASEMPSAGRPLTHEILAGLRRAGVRIARLTHAAGLSSTGDLDLDRRLPLPERYEIPEDTVRAIQATRGEGGRVFAVGTTVVRALEGAFRTHGELRAGMGVTDLRIEAGFEPKVVDAILTGMHAREDSHYALLAGFASEAVLDAAWDRGVRDGYERHELGDVLLVH
ncbi:MAG: S-adenosylmethionine:tRNA ribosyltransferase-isomerase [Deltaproteobacteria bacterium]|nr:S-adenosylmethionine:tRNA ribosyltransferase-isomerase [Deltaproteobacteria bacterium]